MIGIQAVVFDMDGVIFDSERLVQESWAIVAERHDIANISEACRRCLGLCQADAEKVFRSIYGDDFPYWDYKYECRDIYWNELYGDHLPLKPGIRELLEALQAKKIPIAVASSTSEKTVRRELTDAGLISFFTKLICGDMVTRSKPDPEIYRTACEALGADPEFALAIEDSFNGIRSAHEAGMITVMVPDQVAPTEEIRELCDAVCDSLHDVRIMIE